MNSDEAYDGAAPAAAGNSSNTVSVEDQKLPLRPSQPPYAFLLHKIGPELLDMIMSYSCDPDSGPPAKRSRLLKGRANLVKWSLVSRGLSFAAARRIWHTVILTSDAHAVFVQNVIAASGGRDGRVGSSIRMIYTTFHWTRNPQMTSTLAADCSTLLRLDAPISTLGPPTSFHRLQVLTLFGNRKKIIQTFSTQTLAGLVALKHLTVHIRLEIAPDCPMPTFSLTSLTWQGNHQPEAVRWLLQTSTALRVLMLRTATASFLQECLVQHGATLLSLRLLFQGSIATDQFPQLLDQIGAHCPDLLELIWDICPDAGDFDRLPPNIQHLALKPGRKTNMFTGDTFLDWINGRLQVQVLTLWGSHAQNLLHRIKHPYKTKHKGFNAQVHTAKVWRTSDLLSFAPIVCGDIEWPFEDTRYMDYISPVVPDLRLGC